MATTSRLIIRTSFRQNLRRKYWIKDQSPLSHIDTRMITMSIRISSKRSRLAASPVRYWQLSCPPFLDLGVSSCDIRRYGAELSGPPTAAITHLTSQNTRH